MVMLFQAHLYTGFFTRIINQRTFILMLHHSFILFLSRCFSIGKYCFADARNSQQPLESHKKLL